ncbi:hypothetical protein MMC19_007681 [Ptychographa xylographoides]|nr:hypothetical protein [Ptychographa xylographoides]
MSSTSAEVSAQLPYLTVNVDHHRGADFRVIDPNTLRRHCMLDNHRPTQGFVRSNPVTSTLGELEKLPREIINMVLLTLDLEALTVMRRVNICARRVISRLPEYKIVIEQAPSVLRAFLSVKLGSFTTLQRIYDALCSETCVGCGRFAPMLYLFTCSRVCGDCLISDNSFLPKPINLIELDYGLGIRSIRELPALHAIPGLYSHNGVIRRDRTVLIDTATAEAYGIGSHGSVAAMNVYVNREKRFLETRYAMNQMEEARHPTGRNPPVPPHRAYWDRGSFNPHRFMGILRIPVVYPKEKRAEWGLHCRDCFVFRRNNLTFMSKTYYSHFLQCEKAQKRLRDLPEKLAEANQAYQASPVIMGKAGWVHY